MTRPVSLLLLLLLILAGRTTAQLPQGFSRCGDARVMQLLERQHPGFRQRLDATFHSAASAAAERTTGTVYRIPLVFHVVYHSGRQNLADSVLYNQITVLNNAYRKRHADTGNVRDIFKPLSADAEIEFYLPDHDPNGKLSSGIIRTYTPLPAFGSITDYMSALERVKYSGQGGAEPWPTDRYLNVWIADMTNTGAGIPLLLGYATPPLNPLPPNWAGADSSLRGLRDGVVVQYQTVGDNNPYAGDLLGIAEKGRTLVHEIGHYLGLRHISGDPENTAEECVVDDGITDTPPQTQSSQTQTGCPAPDKNTCGAGKPGDLPDMWENYMDYSSDRCQGLFTLEQVAHMRSILSRQRDTLTMPGLELPTGINQAAAPVFRVYPQPADNSISIGCNDRIDEVRLLDITGRSLLCISGNDANQKHYDVSMLPSGTYLLVLRSREQRSAQRLVILH